MVEDFTHSTFSGLLGQTFDVCRDGTSLLSAVLIEAAVLPTGRDRPRPPFSLIFRGPRSPWQVQGTYEVRHALLGAFELFLVPIGPDAEGMRYEAIFN